MGIWSDSQKHFKLLLPSTQSTKLREPAKLRRSWMVNCILIWNQGYFSRHAAEYYERITEWMCVCVTYWGCSGLSTHTYKTHSSGGFGKWELFRETLPSLRYHSELFKYAWQLWSLSSPQCTTCWSLTPGVKDHLATILVYTDSHSSISHSG